ncbi:MAG: class III extradiol dioxygenase family protein [Pseudomonadota bacterium]|nr:MAG: protocatechuate 3,4-dioxygenase [Pseudomonadota bacterium]
MAKIVGAIMTSHVPMIGRAIANRNLQQDPYFKPFFDGLHPVRDWLARVKPDVAVLIYNDHGLNFFLDNLPTFAVGAAPVYHNADEGWGLPPFGSFAGDPRLSWHVIECLIEDEFDIATCQQVVVDHAFSIPMLLLWPDERPVRTVPILINTVQHPLPSPVRCAKFGRAIGRALESYEEDIRIVVVGTGGLSHQLEGTRAGFINKAFDLECIDSLATDPSRLTRYTSRELVALAGAQGVEILNWITARAALEGAVREIHRNYHIPISNTAAGTLLLEPLAA